MRVKSPFVFLMMFCAAALWQVVSAEEEVSCTVREGDGWIEYRVPEHHATDCGYSWSNSSGHVIANNQEKGEKVLNKSDSSLRIRECSERMAYRRDCISEGAPRISNCNVTCRDVQPHKPQDKGVVAYIIVAVCVGLVLLAIACWCFKCGPMRCSPADVEAQHQSVRFCYVPASKFSSVPSQTV